MAAIKYKVKLAESERSRLNEVSHRGKPSVRSVKWALALLKADEGLRDGEIAGVLLINAATVARVRRRFVEERLEAAINDKSRPGRERKLDGKQEAHQAGSAPGCHRVQQSTRRTCELDAPSAGGQGGGDGVCREHLLGDGALGDGAPDTQKTNSSRGGKRNGASPS